MVQLAAAVLPSVSADCSKPQHRNPLPHLSLHQSRTQALSWQMMNHAVLSEWTWTLDREAYMAEVDHRYRHPDHHRHHLPIHRNCCHCRSRLLDDERC
jgi:hypothetical protein